MQVTRTGVTETAIVFDEANAGAFERNLIRLWGYIYALEAAPSWEGEPPPRVEYINPSRRGFPMHTRRSWLQPQHGLRPELTSE